MSRCSSPNPSRRAVVSARPQYSCYAITGFSLAARDQRLVLAREDRTRPVHDLAEAARRMREGVYNEPIDIRTADESASSPAASTRCSKRSQTASGASPPGASRSAVRATEPRAVDRATARRDRSDENDERRELGARPSRRHRIVARPPRRRGGRQARSRSAAQPLARRAVLGHLSAPRVRHRLAGRDAREAVEWIEFQADALRAGVRVTNANISLQATGGIACYPEHSEDPAELCRRASSARSEALARHQTSAVYRLGQDEKFAAADPDRRRLPARADATASCGSRFSRSSTHDTRDLRRRGAGALATPRARAAYPDAFIPAVEQAGSIAHLTRWVLREAVARCAAWRNQGVQSQRRREHLGRRPTSTSTCPTTYSS